MIESYGKIWVRWLIAANFFKCCQIGLHDRENFLRGRFHVRIDSSRHFHLEDGHCVFMAANLIVQILLVKI